jgi:hypothetical protein
MEKSSEKSCQKQRAIFFSLASGEQSSMDNVKDSNKKWYFVLKIVLTNSEKKMFQ